MVASELITAVLRRLAILSATDSPTAEQVQQHIETLNDMMAHWEAEGIDLGYSRIESGTETVYTEPESMHAIKAGLVMLLAVDYDKPVTNEMAGIYADAKAVLVRRAVEPKEASLFGVVPFNGIAGSTDPFQ